MQGRRTDEVALPGDTAGGAQEYLPGAQRDAGASRGAQAAAHDRQRVGVLPLDQPQQPEVAAEEIQESLITRGLGERNGLLQVRQRVLDPAGDEI